MNLQSLLQFEWAGSGTGSKSPCFEGWWMRQLQPPIKVPHNPDKAYRLKQRNQEVTVKRGNKKVKITISVSVFMKLESGHTMADVRLIATLLPR